MTTLLPAGLLASVPALADAEDPRTPGNFGLGLGGGTSTAGLSMKYYTTRSTSLQGVIGAGYGPFYDFEMPNLAEGRDLTLGWCLGPGVGLWLDDDFAGVAAAGVAGLELGIVPVPLDVVVEYRPRLLLTPEVGFDWCELTGHVRYYF